MLRGCEMSIVLFYFLYQLTPHVSYTRAGTSRGQRVSPSWKHGSSAYLKILLLTLWKGKGNIPTYIEHKHRIANHQADTFLFLT